MNQTISQKIKASKNGPTIDYFSLRSISEFKPSGINTNTFRPESLKPQAIKYFKFVDIIQEFSNLGYNWDSYNAETISRNAISKAIETLDYLNINGILSSNFAVSVFPMRDGGIQFEFDGDNICAELEISPAGDLTFILFDDEGNIVEKSQLFELSELSTLLEDTQNGL